MNSVNKRDEILEKKRSDFQNNLSKLFDVGACKCRFFQTCSCKITMKVTKEEQVLLLDQRGKRKMIISGVDPKITRRNLKKVARKQSTSYKCIEPTKSTPQCTLDEISDEEINIVHFFV